jgi:hypothetical protein
VSSRLEAGTTTDAGLDRAWEVLVDWAGQSRWIPLTTVAVRSPQPTGLGVRLAALSGRWLGRLPIGLLDNFVVTGWSPPQAGTAELEILHLGPYFTGEGVFRLTDEGGRTRVSCTELITVPGGAPVNAVVRAALPLLRAGFAVSLRRFAAVAEGRRGR